MSNLRKTTLSGLAWTFSQQFGVQLISFCITIILARLLAPSEFGLIAMLTIFMAAGSVLVDGGLSSSLIRSDDVTQRDYSTVFFFNLMGSIVIYALVFSLAPYIAHFYKQEILISVIRVYAIIFVMNAFYEIQNARLTKAMNFRTQTIIQIPAVLAGGLLGVIMAMHDYGVWSLVWMNILQSFLITLFHWVLSGWRPSLIFDKASFKTHFNFGYKMTLSGLLEIIYKNIYVLIIGKNYSATQLGYYSRADSLSQLPTGNIATAMNKVTYPMFASISQDNMRLKVVYKKLMQQVIFWNAACLILLYVIAEPLFRFLITDRWLPAVPYFKILCIAGILYPLHAYNLNILKVKGRSDLLLRLEGIKKTISIAGIFCVIPFGIYGLLYFQLLFNIVACYINSFYSGEMINYPVKEQLKDIFPTLILSVATGIVCHLVDNFLEHSLHLPDIGRLLIDSFTFFTVYLGSSHLTQLDAMYDFKQLILRR